PTAAPTPTRTLVPSVTPTLTPSATPVWPWAVVDKGTTWIATNQPVLKGQVRDAQGRLVTGGRAMVGISVNGDYRSTDSFRNPAPTNADGWYEFYLQPGQYIQIVKLFVDGREVSLYSLSTTWWAEASRWWHVTLREGPGPYLDDPDLMTRTRAAAETATAQHLPTRTPLPGGFFGTVDHWVVNIPSGNPVVKGQVFDRQGYLLTNGRASVGISVDGTYFSSPTFRNPQPTNEEGWYEIFVGRGQRIRIVKLFIDGQEANLDNQDQSWMAKEREWWHVDIRER
ncbi:MAG: hypothetical protein V1772_09130, partial [Chloroflexota bacterium]